MSAAFPKSTTDAHWNITCHNVSFNFDNINHLLIRGLKFVGCGNNRVLSVKNFTVKNSTFVGQWRSGTALDITQTDTTIENSQFLSNTVGSCQIDPVNYLNYSTYALVRGAVRATLSNVVTRKCIFEGNSAEIGGAIFVHCSNITIINSTFIENHVVVVNFSIDNNVTQCSDGSPYKNSRIDSNLSMIEFESNTILTQNNTLTKNVWPWGRHSHD